MGWGQPEAVGTAEARRQEGNRAGPGNNESLAVAVPGGWVVWRDKAGETRWGHLEGHVLRFRQYPWVLAPWSVYMTLKEPFKVTFLQFPGRSRWDPRICI